MLKFLVQLPMLVLDQVDWDYIPNLSINTIYDPLYFELDLNIVKTIHFVKMLKVPIKLYSF